MRLTIKKDTMLRVALFFGIVVLLVALWILYAMYIWDGR